MPAFLDQLQAKKILVADGATGTNLQKVGLPPGGHTEDWIFDKPEEILQLESAFVEAGADILLTCTFGATRIRLKGSKYADNVVELNRQAATLARQSASRRPGVLVAGSMGPLGQLLQPYGPISPTEAFAAYAEQARALADGGVDLLVIETQFSVEEATAAIEAAHSSGDLPLVASFSYDRGIRTMMGVRPSVVASKIPALGVAMVGGNCGTTLENMEVILEEYATTIPGSPLWAKPNAGLPRLEGATTVYDVSPRQMAEFAQRAIRLGARVVGGCCGSTPEHVGAVAALIGREGPGNSLNS